MQKNTSKTDFLTLFIYGFFSSFTCKETLRPTIWGATFAVPQWSIPTNDFGVFTVQHQLLCVTTSEPQQVS